MIPPGQDIPSEPSADDELSHTRMSFGDHLMELRSRLIRALLATLLGFILVWTWVDDVMGVVKRPYDVAVEDLGQRMPFIATGVGTTFFAYMKVAFIVSLIVSAPVWIYQLWAFIGAGLYRRERKLVYSYFPLCIVLFAGGVVFGYFVLLPIGLAFLLGFSDPALVQNYTGISEYLGFFAIMTLLLGAAFQLPVVMLGLGRTGVMTIPKFKKNRKFVILGIFIVAAVVTPPDPVSQTLLAVPLCLLYELGIFLVWIGLGKDRTPVPWAVVRRRLRKLAVVVLVLFLFRGPLLDLWHRSRADAGVVAADSKHGPDVERFAGELLGAEVTALYRVVELKTIDRYAVVAGGKFFVIEVEKAWVKDRVTDRRGRGIEVEHNPGGLPVYRFHKPERVPYRDFVPVLLDALKDGSDDTVAVVRPVIEALTGAALDSDRERAVAALSSWYDLRKDAVLEQPE